MFKSPTLFTTDGRRSQRKCPSLVQRQSPGRRSRGEVSGAESF